LDYSLFRRDDDVGDAKLATAGTRLGAGRLLWRDRRGATSVIVAISTPILLATAGLGIDAGWWYTIKRQNQSAADAAAMSAAYEVAAGLTDVSKNLTPAAKQAATQNGWVNNTNPPTGLTPIAVTYPCCAGFAANGIEVVLQQQQSSWLANFGSLANVTISNRAVAVVSNLPPACVLALGRNPPPNGAQTLDQTVSEKGNATINAPDCTIVSDSSAADSFYLQGSVTIDAATVVTPGQITSVGGSYTLNLKYPAQTGANSVPDPYAPPNCTTLCLTHSFLDANMPTAPACTLTGSTWSGNCVVSGGSVKPGQTLSANTQISGGLGIKNGEVDLQPGTYWITDGDLTLDHGSGGILTCPTCSAGGPGVTIIMTTAQASGGTVGTVTLFSNANLTLNAPDSGTFAGLVLIQDSNGLPPNTTIDTQNKTPANANATEKLSGLVYFPDTTLSFQGTPTSNLGAANCLVIVANQVQLQGNPAMAVGGCGSLGLNTLPFPKTITLVD
jgi:Flp pilus assembly protein TadG